MEETEINGQRRGPYLPLEQRIRLHGEVLRLRKQGLSYNRIIQRIHRTSGVQLHKSNIGDWVNGEHQPLGIVNKFDPRPSPELAGVIGAALSDGDINRHADYAYEIRLRVNDRDYAEAFGRDLAKVLGKEKPYKPRWGRRERCWIVTGRSILLFKHLGRPWEKLMLDIEASKTCVARFLRRFFDGEGSIKGRALRVYNSNRNLLVYIQRLLQQYFGIESTGPYRNTKAGHLLRNLRAGKTYKSKRHCYYLYVPVSSLARFHRYIGFTIKRKQLRLTEAIQK